MSGQEATQVSSAMGGCGQRGAGAEGVAGGFSAHLPWCLRLRGGAAPERVLLRVQGRGLGLRPEQRRPGRVYRRPRARVAPQETPRPRLRSLGSQS